MMTREEYKAGRIELDLTQVGLGEVLGITRQTVWVRENVVGAVGIEAELALLSLLNDKRRVIS